MINDYFIQNVQHKNQNLIVKALLFPIFFFLLFQVNVYSQQAGNCLRMTDGTTPPYAEGTGISTPFTALTVEAWIITDNIQSASIQRFVSVGGDGAVLRHGATVNIVEFYLHFTSGSIPIVSVSLTVPEQKKWTHLAGTWDGSTMKLYVNGKEVANAAASGTLSMDNFIRISTSDANENWTGGWIDEIRLWNVARTIDQIRDNMYKEFSGSETGLTNYWKFNETSGTVADDFIGSANLTFHNFTQDTWLNSGAFAGPRYAIDLDGTNKYVSISDHSSLHLSNTITIEAWVYPTNLNGRFSIYSTRSSNDAGSYQLEIGDGDGGTGANRVVVSGVSTWIAETDDNAISTNVWTHIVYTRSGTGAGTHKIYINGVEQSLISDNAYSFVDNTNAKLIGAGILSGNRFAGQIDEVRIWNDVRTQAEIAGNMCMTLKGNEAGLVSYWRFDQVSGTQAPDITSNNVGTLINMEDDDWVSATEFNTWVGLNGGNFWNSADIDWSLGIKPTSSHNAGIPEADPNSSSFELYVDCNTQVKNLSISSNVELGVYNAHTLTISGNVLSAGTLSCVLGSEKIILSDGSSIHGIYASSLDEIEINDAIGAKMLRNCTINEKLTLTSGDLDLNGYNITLGSNAELLENSGTNLKGTSGKISITKNVGTDRENIGGLGFLIDSDVNLGSTTVERTHSAAVGAGHQGILRKYYVHRTTNTAMNARVYFCYNESELNGISEGNLDLFKSSDGSDNSWTKQNGVLNPDNNSVTLEGVNELSYWTLGDKNNALPVELISFMANAVDGKVILNWKTATEVNNYGFNVERRTQSAEWELIGFVQGHGNSNSQKQYSFEDINPPPGKLQYRLKQIDFDGKYEYSDVVDVNIDVPAKFELAQNFPNPFNPSTVISYQLPVDGIVSLKIFDILGREVAVLVNEFQNAGKYNITFNGQQITDRGQLPSGIYFYRITAGAFVQTKKLLLLK